MAASNPGVALYILKPNTPFLRFHLNTANEGKCQGASEGKKERGKNWRMKNPSGSIHGAKEILIFKHHLSRATWSFFSLYLNTLPQVLPSRLPYTKRQKPLHLTEKLTGLPLFEGQRFFSRTDWTVVKLNIKLHLGVPWMQETLSATEL